MTEISLYHGRLVIEYFTPEQWKALHETPQNETEEKLHRQLTEDRYAAFRQIRKLCGVEETEEKMCK